MRDVLTGALLLTACTLTLFAGLGLLRFQTVFARTHPVTKAITLGVVTVCLAAALQVDEPSDVFRLLLVAGFQIITAPIAAHMVARAAHRVGTSQARGLPIDELRDAEEARAAQGDGGGDA